MDFTGLMYAIASLSASFVAILGGLLVSRLITINGERSSYSRELCEVSGQLIYYRGLRNLIDRNRHEEDAIRYIYNHIEELMDDLPIEDVYEEAELNPIDFADLEPLWIRAQEIKAQFTECLKSEDCDLNSDMIPITLAEEYSDDPFAYEFCKIYADWNFSDSDFDETPFRETGSWYDRDNQKAMEYTTQILMLDMREKQLTNILKSLEKPAGMKSGLILFALFSFFNIVCPLSFSIIPFSERQTVTISIVSVLFLTLGLVGTFVYLIQMLKWKKLSDLY